MNDNLVSLFDNAQLETLRLVSGIRPDQWDAQTPCEHWSVRHLLNHLVAGNRLFAAVAHGEEADRSAFARDNLGEDPVGAYRDSARELQKALSRPGVLDGTYRLPVGALPGPAMVTLRLTETLAHGWDLARATGQTPRYDPEAVRMALEWSQRMPRRTGPDGPFKPATDQGPEATDLDRLAALLGRETS